MTTHREFMDRHGLISLATADATIYPIQSPWATSRIYWAVDAGVVKEGSHKRITHTKIFRSKTKAERYAAKWVSAGLYE